MTCAIEREDGDASARPHLSLRNDNEPWELKKTDTFHFLRGHFEEAARTPWTRWTGSPFL